MCVVLDWPHTVTRDGSVRLMARTDRAAVSCQRGFERVLGAFAPASPTASYTKTHKHTHTHRHTCTQTDVNCEEFISSYT